jgi:hypothetical protein
MKSAIRWASVVLVVLAAQALSGGSGSSGSTAISRLPRARSSTGIPFAKVTLVSALPPASLSMAWTLDGISANGRSLDVTFVKGDGDCVHFAGFYVQESKSTVSLTDVGITANDTPACASRLVTGRMSVKLRRPLGSRALLHPAMTSGWTQAG